MKGIQEKPWLRIILKSLDKICIFVLKRCRNSIKLSIGTLYNARMRNLNKNKN